MERRRLVNIGLLFVAILGVGISVATKNVEAADWEGWAQQARSYQDKISKLDNELTKETAATLEKKLQTAKDAQKWAEVIDIYEALLQKDPDRFASWVGLGEAWRQFKFDDDRGVAALYKALNLEADNKDIAEVWNKLGQLFERRQAWDYAQEAYQKSLNFSSTKEVTERLMDLQKVAGLFVVKVDVESNTDRPSVCIRFSEPLSTDKNIHYRDYMTLDPSFDVAIDVRNDQLCFQGFKHNTSYKLTLREGLPSAKGRKLYKAFDQTIKIDNRPSQLGFMQDKTLLPMQGHQLLPLTSVNVDTAELALYKINDRNLINQVNGYMLSWSEVDRWELEEIQKTKGQLIKKAEIDLKGNLNQMTTTGIPIKDFLSKPEPGIYVLSAKEKGKEDDYQIAVQWLTISDIALSSAEGTDGFYVFARSLESAEPLKNIELSLIARNNTVLATIETNKKGQVVFPSALMRGEDGLRPAAIYAYSDDEGFSFLKLSAPAFDLSDRGVGGRANPGALDAYVYLDRGVYKPGEVVHAMALLRDGEAKAVADLPLTFRLVRPNMTEADKFPMNKSTMGGFQLDIPLPKSAMTGMWTLEAYADPKGKPVGQVDFAVEDFVPLRIEADLTSDTKVIAPNEETLFKLKGRYLYGSPAAELNVESEVIIDVAEDPFPDFKDFHFGLVQSSFDSQRVELDPVATNDQGEAEFTASLPDLSQAQKMLMANIRSSIFDVNGRPTTATLKLPIRIQPIALGIKPLFENDEANPGSDIKFNIVALDQKGKLTAQKNMTYELIAEDWDYQWYYSNGGWTFKTIIRDRLLQQGTLDAAADKPSALSLKMPEGRYRLEVRQNDATPSSYRFHAGWWYEPGSTEAPDKLNVQLDKDTYSVGDKAKIFIKAPFEGEVLLMVGNHKVIDVQNITLKKKETTIEIPVTEAWGVGAYVMATAYRPLGDDVNGVKKADKAEALKPTRAIGLAWAGIDQSKKQIKVNVGVPTKNGTASVTTTKPRQLYKVPVTLEGVDSHERVYLTLSAVDEGILLLTNFESPNPTDYYFGKRSLGVELRDVYGQLLTEQSDKVGVMRFGGDMLRAFERQSSNLLETTQTVALFSGLITVPSDGKVEIPLNLPDFNGELRLMAVAYSQNMIGEGESKLQVRDPVVMDFGIPRFLGLGDEATVALHLNNVEAPDGDYTVTIKTSKGLQISTDPIKVAMKKGENTTALVKVKAAELGDQTITMTLSGPGNLALEKNSAITIRPSQPVITERHHGVIEPKQIQAFDQKWLENFLPERRFASVTLSSGPIWDVKGLMKELYDYPYGCLEQTVSRAWPWLYFNDLKDKYQLDDGSLPLTATPPDTIVQQAISAILNLQKSNGSFGLWSSMSPEEPWLSVYALDFLLRAKEKGFHVPETALKAGANWLKSSVAWMDDQDNLYTKAYAYYVLAKLGMAQVSELRYLQDNVIDKNQTSPLAIAQVAAALQFMGEADRATKLFDLAVAEVGKPRERKRDFGSDLRDLAAIISLMGEAKMPYATMMSVADKAEIELFERDYYSTQEIAWLMNAAAVLTPKDPMQIVLDGKTEDGKNIVTFDMKNQDHKVENVGSGPVYYQVTTQGIPAKPLEASDQGIKLEKRLYTLDGKEVTDTAGVVTTTPNNLYVVLLHGQMASEDPAQLLAVDLLPAGFEIENENLNQGRTMEDLTWLPQLDQPIHAEKRHDRYVAAIDLGFDDSENVGEFYVAYLVRATTPGHYTYPGAFCEDMAQPFVNGRTATKELEVK